jgi:hypothetical protein
MVPFIALQGFERQPELIRPIYTARRIASCRYRKIAA